MRSITRGEDLEEEVEEAELMALSQGSREEESLLGEGGFFRRPPSPTEEDTALQRGFRTVREFGPVAGFLERAGETSRVMGEAVAS